MGTTAAMITRKLWRALYNPPTTHPLYKRTITQENNHLMRAAWTVAGLIGITLVVLNPSVFLTIIFGVPIILALWGGTFYGTAWAGSIAGVIVKERQQGVYELFSLAPGGPLTASWAICTGRLHRDRALKRLFSDLVWTIRAILGFTALSIVTVLLTPATQMHGQSILIATTIVTLMTASYFDHVQAIIMSSLVGIFTAHHAHNRTDGRLIAMCGFLLLQLFSYISAWFVGFVVFPTLYQQFGMSGWYADMLMLLLRVAVFFGIREAIIRILWILTLQSLNADTSEFDAAVNFVVNVGVSFDDLEAMAQAHQQVV
jgi:hypothetical protein